MRQSQARTSTPTHAAMSCAHMHTRTDICTQRRHLSESMSTQNPTQVTTLHDQKGRVRSRRSPSPPSLTANSTSMHTNLWKPCAWMAA
jgi:hypothetical protein